MAQPSQKCFRMGNYIITGMSWGTARGLIMKIALAKAASMAGTATNTGEAPLLKEERETGYFKPFDDDIAYK